jgi:hypothetical protein
LAPVGITYESTQNSPPSSATTYSAGFLAATAAPSPFQPNASTARPAIAICLYSVEVMARRCGFSFSISFFACSSSPSSSELYEWPSITSVEPITSGAPSRTVTFFEYGPVASS